MSNHCDTLLKVLVVEDECMVRSLIVDFLEEAGCVVVEARTAERAIAVCNSGVPLDAVFTDIGLPGTLSGWDVGEAARSARGEIPVVYASGSLIEQARPVSDSLFFNKPYRPADILNACRRLRHNRAQKQVRAKRGERVDAAP